MRRRDFCRTALWAGVAAASAPLAGSVSSAPSALSGRRLYEHLVHFTEIGEHRTGTTGDLATSEWIRGRFESLGLATALHPVPLNLFDVTSAFLEIGFERFRVDPEWFPVATAPEGLRAPLRKLAEGQELATLAGAIWVVEVQMERPVVPPELKEKALAAARAGALGVVMVLRYRTSELTGRGAHGERGQSAWCPIPLVAVAAKHGEVVEAAGRGATARLVVQGVEQPGAEAFNAYGTWEGARSNASTIVVTTPQSGMFRCGGERGGGIALLLGLAEWVATRQPEVRYVFSTNTGHEQSGSGARVLLEKGVPPPEQVRAWLHLGSGIATWDWQAREDGTYERSSRQSGVRNFGAVAGLAPVLRAAFEAIPGLEPQSSRFAGELRAYVERGYPAFGFWGYNDFGHTVADGPEQSAPELLEPVARCLATALESIERG